MNVSSRPLVIESRGAEIKFSESAGVFDLNVQVPEGTILGLIGPSGCGKTTAMRMMMGTLAPQKGEIRVLGQIPTKFGVRERQRIGYIPQLFVLYPNLTVAENIHFVAAMYGMAARDRRRRMDELLEFVELEPARHRLARQLSGGMQRRLMLAGALMHEPSLLFADEPTAGIDPILRDRFWDYFRKLRDEGCTLVISTQYVGEAAFCDQVAVMRKGRLVAADTPERLRRKAIGGEVIALDMPNEQLQTAVNLLTATPRSRNAEQRAVLDQILRVELKRDTTPDGRDERYLHIFVNNAAASMSGLLNILENHGITIEKASEYQTSYDDVFVTLMQQAEAQEKAELSRAAAQKAEVSRG